MAEDIVRVLRVVEYTGPRSWVEDAVSRSIHGTKTVGPGRTISAATVGHFPEILKPNGALSPDEIQTG